MQPSHNANLLFRLMGRSEFRTILGAAAAHLGVSVALAVYGLVRTGGDYWGADASAVKGLVPIILGHFAIRGVLVPSFMIAAAAVPIAFLANRARFSPVVVGSGFYMAVSSLLLAAAPAAVSAYPALSRVPFLFTFVGLVLLGPVLAMTFYVGWKERVLFQVSLLAIVLLPHDLPRSLLANLQTGQSTGGPKLLVVVVDALRLDYARAILGDRWPVVTGFSHFGSTRKQYRLLEYGPSEALEAAIFVPSKEELARANLDSSLIGLAERGGLSFQYMTDEALTANSASTGIPRKHFEAPSKGVQEGLAAGMVLLPWSSWLWNVVSPVEGINPWSNFDTYLRDVERMLKRRNIVIAHTVWLQSAPSTADEFSALLGPKWFLLPPRYFRLLPSNPSSGDEKFIDAYAAYQVRVEWLLRRSVAWSITAAAQFKATALITSDHGQLFFESTVPGRHLSGVHGWSLEPETFWIPFIPVAGVEIDSSQVSSWTQLRESIAQFIGDPRSFRLISVTSMDSTEIPVIESPNIASTVSYPPDVLTPKGIARNLSVEWRSGWFVPADLSQRFPVRSKARVAGSKLAVQAFIGAEFACYTLYTPIPCRDAVGGPPEVEP